MFRRFLLLVVAGLFLVSCAGTTDQDRVTSILRNTAQWAKTADTEFKASMDAIDSLQAGRPMYQVADLLQQHFEQLDRSTIQIARPYENEAKEIKDSKVRDLMREGIKAIHLVYDQKRTFVRETQAALNKNDGAALTTAIKKHKDNSGAEMAGMIMCTGYFLEAKKALGMQPNLDELKQ